MSQLLSRIALARTYSHPSYPDAWEVVEDYHRVQEYASHHPNKGSQAIATRLELPRSRIRPWLAESKPDAVRAIEVAEKRRWFNATASNERGRAFAVLIAATLAAGSIATEYYTPAFALSTADSRDEVETALSILEVEYEYRHPDSPDRATELVASQPGSVLGRALVVLGAPSGGKSKTIQFPKWIFEASLATRLAFCRLYVRERGAEHTDKATRNIKEDRSSGFRKSLAQLIEKTTGESATVGKNSVIVSAAAVRELRYFTSDVISGIESPS